MLTAIGENALYNEFRRDEPWDSEHNLKLIPRMPKAFLMPGAKPAPVGHTYYKVFVPTPEYVGGKYEPMWGVRQSPTMRQLGPEVDDTILVIEAAEPVIWTKPDDFFVDGRIDDLTQPLGFQLGATPRGDECMACFGGAEVHVLRVSLQDPSVYKECLRRMIGCRDGEAVDWRIRK